MYCFQGKSRSVSVVAAYLMKFYNVDFLVSLSWIRETRPAAEPNLGFGFALRKFDRALKAERSVPSCDELAEHADLDKSS